MDEEQLRQAYESLLKAMQDEADQKRVLGKVSTETQKALKELRAQIQDGTKATGKSLSDLAKSTAEVEAAEKKREAERERYVKRMQGDAAMLTKTLGSMAGAAASGNTNFTLLQGTVTGLAKAIGGIASGFPLFGKVLDKTAQALGEGAAFILSRLDEVAEAYNELGKVGAITAEGIDGVREQFKEMGLVGLPEFVEAVKANSVALRALGPTVGQGANVLAKSFGILTKEGGEYRDTLLLLGYNTKDIAKISTEIAANQLLMGNRRIKNERDLAKATFEYMKEIDALARATGQSKEAILDEQKKNRLDVAFNEYVNDLMKVNPDAAKRLDQVVSGLGGVAAEAMRGIMTGVPTTERAEKAMVLYGDVIREQIELVKQGLAPEKARQRIMEAGVDRLSNQYSDLVKLNVTDALGGPDAIRQIQEWRAQLQGGALSTEESKNEQDKLTKNTSKLNKDFVTAQAQIAEFARETQRLGFDFIQPAATAVKEFTKTLVDGVKAIRKVLKLPDSEIPVDRDATGGAFGGNRMGRAARRKREELEKKKQEQGQEQGQQGKPGPGTTGEGLRGAAAKNLNPGNLRFANQPGAVPGAEGFAAFPSVDEGLVALARQLNLYLTGESKMGKKETLADIISTYAPPNENKSKQYIDAIANFMGMDANAKLPRDAKTLAKLMVGIIGYENHGDPRKGYNFRSGIQFAVSQILGVDPSKIGKFAKGGITQGPSIAGEAGPEAVVPLPDGKSIPVQMDMQSVVNSIKTELGALPEGLGKELDQGMIEVLEWAKGMMAEMISDPKLLKEAGVTEEDMKKSLADAESVLQDWKKQMATGVGPMQGFQEQVVPAMLNKLMSETSPASNAQYREAVLNAPEHEELSVNGLTTEGRYSAGPLRTYDTKLTGMIMERLGATDARTRREINLSGIGTNYSMMGADFGSNIGGGMAHAEITDRVASLVESGQPLQEALKTTLAEFQSALQELVNNQSGAEGEGMMALISQLVDLQRSQNATSERILQVSQN